MSSILGRRTVLSWALYDWANSAFATTVMAGFFPVFFSSFWSLGANGSLTTARLGFANGIASLLVAVLAPIIGAVADRGGVRKKFLFVFAGLGIVMSGGLYFVQQGNWAIAALLYVCATAGFAGSNVFYDSMIVDVSRPEEFDMVSAYGYSLGYLGGGLLFAVNVLMTIHPAWFGLADAAQAVRVSFLSVAVWWLVFSLPLLLWVREAPTEDRQPSLGAVRAGLKQLAETIRAVRLLKPVLIFLCAYWLYIDGVYTIIKLAVDYGIRLGFDSSKLVLALLLTQFVAFPAALFFGWVARFIGVRTGILIALGVYALATIWASMISEVWEFFGLAITIGLVQGGVQSLSRSMYARLIPADKSGEFFGFYNMLGKFASILGPFLVGVTALVSNNPRLSILAILPLFLIGAFILTRVEITPSPTVESAAS
ncbi:MAG: MFS transporter [Gammaproteobacteria bacterium]|nr:MFS transporter [Gammaproteobacteria bacterium]